MKPWVPALAFMIALLGVQLALDPSFFSIALRDGRAFGSLIDVLLRTAPVLIIAVGMSLVIATGGVDLSVGSVAAISGVIASCLVARPETSPLYTLLPGAPVPVIMAVALLAGLACGILNGLLVSKVKIQPIVATLILMTGGRGIAQLLSAGNIINYHSADLSWLARGTWLALPVPVWLALGITVVAATVAHAFPLGRLVSASGSNPVAAEYAGISVGRIQVLVYGFTGLCAALAGLIWSGDIQAADANNIGVYSELDAILAVAIGGTSLSGGRFSLIGTAIGAVLMRLITTMLLTRGVEPPLAMVLKGLLVVIACAIQSPQIQAAWAARRRVAA